jgi:RNA polymerase sigma-70 factor (ECF subfamily)
MEERRRRSRPLVGLDDLDVRDAGIEPDADRGVLLARLLELIQRLRPLDRELVILYLEGLSAAEMALVALAGPIQRCGHPSLPGRR